MKPIKSWSWGDIRKSTIFEDNTILAINKPQGIAVVGASNEFDILKLAGNAGEILFPVHRIDKVTSGLVLFAKNINIHAELTRQFNKRTVDKQYLAIVQGTGISGKGEINLPLSIGRKNAVRIAAKREDILFDEKTNTWSIQQGEIFTDVKVYPSQTGFTKLFEDEERTLLAVNPITGRHHQIRVHLAWIGYPILGDPLFAKEKRERTYLHSWKLTFDKTWENSKRMQLKADPDDNFLQLFHPNKQALKDLIK